MFSKGKYTADLESTLSRVSEAEIALFYLDELDEIPEVISSPIRKDEHPSFRVYSPDGTKVRFYDYATGQRGSIIDLIMLMYNCSFPEALERIDKDIAEYRKSNPCVSPTTRAKLKADKSILQVRTQRREWEDYDFAYWESYGVPKEWIINADVYPINYIFIVSETGYVKTIKADKYAYTFVERKDGYVTEKVYQPYNREGMKWRSGHNASVWDLWTKLPEKGKMLIITSSRKDALCLWANLGIPSISLQSETTSIKPQVMEELKERFEKVVVLYDNDFSSERNNGREDAERIVNLYGIYSIEIPEKYQSKDPSDLYHNHGKEIFKQVLTQLLKQLW